MVTSLQDWKKPSGTTEEVQLPSGNRAVLKRTDPVEFMTSGGDIPDVLTQIIIDSIQQQGRREFEITKDNLPELLESLNVITCAVFHEPKVVRDDELQGEPTEAVRPLSWISFQDKAFVFAWALGAQFDPAAKFPAQQAQRMATVPNGAGAKKQRSGTFRHPR